MVVNDLCRKCALFTVKGHLVLINPPKKGRRRYRITQRFYLFLDNDDNPDENESEFRSKVSTQDIVKGIVKESAEGEVDASVYARNIFLHHRLDALTTSAESGCHLCMLLRRNFDEGSESAFPGPDSNIRCVPYLIYHDLLPLRPESSAGERRVHQVCSLYPKQRLGTFFVREDLPDHSGYEKSMILLQDGTDLPTQQPTPTGQLIGGIRSDTLVRIQKWLDQCQTHTVCSHNTRFNRLGDLYMPARLISVSRVGSGQRLRLVETQNMDSDLARPVYATLSHCWGRRPIEARLLKCNLKAYMLGISFMKLPRTFREAIEVVTALDVSYLWIDALCIIQDLESDWEKEAPRMREIYSGGAFNIAAVASENSEGGLWCQDSFRTGCNTLVAWTGAYPKVGRLRIGEPSSYHTWITSSVLASRGWVFQERLLSPRIIYFAGDQIWWECRNERHTEFDGVYTVDSELQRLEHEDIFELFSSGKWTSLIEKYSACKITRRSDRLVAVSGIAELFALRQGFEPHKYINGLWRDSLLHDLMWECNRLSNEFSDEDKAWLTSERVAPTWSWASVEPHVIWRQDQVPRLSSDNVASKIFWHEELLILDDTNRSTSENPFRGTRDRRLFIESRLHPVTFSEPDEDNKSLFKQMELSAVGYRWGRNCRGIISNIIEFETVFEFCPDHDTATISGLPAYFMPMERRINEVIDSDYTDKQAFRGLVISPVERKKGTYVRLGILTVHFAKVTTPTWWSTGFKLDESLYLKECSDMVYKIALE